MRAERNSLTKRYSVVLIFILSGVGYGVWHNFQMQHGRSDFVAATVRTVVSAPAAALGRSAHWIGLQTGWIFHGRAAFSEKVRLEGRVAELEAENARLREAQIKYDQLRDDLKFVRTLRAPLLAADIWCRRPDPKFDTVIIARGQRDGIKKYMLVINREGVVGYVNEADLLTASVVLLTDQNAALGARVQRAASRAVGICKGMNGPLLNLTELTNDTDIKPGDLIITSGLSRLYPKNLAGSPPHDLIIGTVAQVKPDPISSGKTALIRPAVDFDRLEQVYVVMDK